MENDIRRTEITSDLKKAFGDGPFDVMIAGTFDLIHPGHINYINEAAQYGRVTVIIARDSVVKQNKMRETVLDEDMRLVVVGALKGVENVVLGDEDPQKWYRPVLQYNPHLFLMGVNQPGDLTKFQKVIRDMGGRTIFKRSSCLVLEYSLKSSTMIRKRVVDVENESKSPSPKPCSYD
ncbi:hypothetical protein EIN_048130 [Entamoeba invadens IP1]|uniref:Cytidyltransferase-like domain-containing protein n=1 Tax=Entamoeba invadens IP1 TaxID=370355 RepID=A0A0A1UH30_ENTIV|nr:hypothetical protein EIN_048130 [Entamoeba invadens IP1]ELP94480.1 hypothetical protein EIN_048130 [Entamoeba invadens IP1]|eukprot:XP_004261251.1 hypothetical protein EIN_048130 [Entamoeba invadens IP1]